MTNLRIIPPDPWAEARERYRVLATEDRPGDPNEFDPRDEREPSNFGMAVAIIAVMVIGLSLIGSIQ